MTIRSNVIPFRSSHAGARARAAMHAHAGMGDLVGDLSCAAAQAEAAIKGALLGAVVGIVAGFLMGMKLK